METFSVELFIKALPQLLKGAALSIAIFMQAWLLSMSVGGIVGVLTCQRLKTKWLSSLLEAIAFIFRAIPFYVQLLIVYFVLPELLNLPLEAHEAAIIALSCCSASYVMQIVRGGINSIAISQWETAYTLGYSKIKTLRYIIFPQMLRNILPALTNECDSLLKSTAILASIGLLELTRVGMNIVSREMEPLTIYLAIALIYVCISGGINLASKWLERRLSYVGG